VGVYAVALAHLIYGKEPQEIMSMANMGETGVDEQGAMILRYDGGGMALLTCAIRTSTPHEAVIFGTEGHIRIPHCFWQPDRIILSKGGDQEMCFERLGNGYSFEAVEAGRCLRQGVLESPIMRWEKTLAVMRTLDQVRAQWGLRYPGE
jgi:dihydrodiol dehydrogenase / D-xylose 1-dehydrogenase (NADP)